MPDEVTTADLLEIATSPKKVVTEEGTVEERSAREAITVNNYAALKGMRSPWGGVKIAKARPPGTV